jgi:hypothetical protein
MIFPLVHRETAVYDMYIKYIYFQSMYYISGGLFEHDNEPSGSIKAKGKVIPMRFVTKHHAMKAYLASECIVPRILDFVTRWR